MYYPDIETFKILSKKGNLIPVYGEILADMETPVSALMKLSSSKHIFLLESVEGGEKWGRYTFLGHEPHIIFKIKEDYVNIFENGVLKTVKHNGNPFLFLQNLLNRYRPVSVDGLPRFYGGAVGFLSYETVRFFEDNVISTKKDVATDDAIFLFTDTLIIFDNIKHTIKVVSCAFTESEKSIESVYKKTTEKIKSLIDLLKQPTKETNTRSIITEIRPQANMTPDEYKSIVIKAKEYIAAGEIIQVVLSQRFQLKTDIDPLNLYRALRFVNPSPYLFFLKFEDMYLIGSSPEVMVRLEDNIAELRPIAGTRKRGKTEQEDRKLADELLEDPKERAEHVMLVDLGRNDLGRVARIGSVQVNQLMVVERYSHVMHLVSNIRAELDEGKNCFDVLMASFPAGTLTGAPKVRAMQIIAELEPSQRGYYGGAVGYFSYSGNMDLCITIRTILVNKSDTYIQVGAGIVADSDPEMEFQETINKAEGMMQAIRLAVSNFKIEKK